MMRALLMLILAVAHATADSSVATGHDVCIDVHALAKLCGDETTVAQCVEGFLSGSTAPQQLMHSSGMQQQPQHRSTALRLLVAALLLLLLVAIGAAYHMLMTDSAPKWITRHAKNYLFPRVDLHQLDSEAGLSKLLSYKLDQQLSRGSKLLIVGCISAALIVFGGLALYAAGEDSLYSAFWLAVAGTGLDWTFAEKAQGADWNAFIMRTVSLMLSIGGMLITALLLGLVSDAIGSKVDELRKGKAPVLENGHTLIIGWSDKIFCLLKELCMGRECLGGRPIVILSEHPKEAMEDAILMHNIALRGSTITCRSGDPLLRSELLKVSAQHAGSVIVLASDTDPEQSDAALIRVVLSLMGMHKELLESGKGGLKGHIVAEVCERDHEDLLMRLGWETKLRTLVPRDVSARMLVQCARHPQKLAALVEIMGFDGSEIYIDAHPSPELLGQPFAMLQALYPKAVPIGYKKADGRLLLRPDGDAILDVGDAMVLVADDDTCLTPDIPKLLAATARAYGNTGSTSQRSARSGNVILDAMQSSLSSLASGVSEGLHNRDWVASLIRAGLPSVTALLAKAADSATLLAGAQVPQSLGRNTAGAGSLEQLHEEGEQQAEEVQQAQVASSAAGHVHWWQVVLSSGDAVNQKPLSEWLVLGEPNPATRYLEDGVGDWDVDARGPQHVHTPWWDRACVEAGAQGLVSAGQGSQGGQGLPLVPEGPGRSLSRAGSSAWSRTAHSPWWDRVLGAAAGGSDGVYEVAPAWSGGLKVPKLNRDKTASRGAYKNGGDAGGSWLGEDDSQCVDIGSLIPWWDRVLAGGQENVLNLFHSADGAGGSEKGPGGTRRSMTVALAAARLLHSFNRKSVKAAAMPKEAAAFCGRFLIIGWRKDMAGLIRTFNEIVTAPSELWLYSDVPLERRTWMLERNGLVVDDAGYSPDLTRLRLVYREPMLVGSLINKWHIQLLEPMQFRSVLLLASDPSAGSTGTGAATRRQNVEGNSSSAHATMSAVDSLTLTTLLILRQTQLDQLVGQDFSSEGQDPGPSAAANGHASASTLPRAQQAGVDYSSGLEAERADPRPAVFNSPLARVGDTMSSCYSSPIFEEGDAGPGEAEGESGVTVHTAMKSIGAAAAAAAAAEAQLQGRRLTFEEEWQLRIMGPAASMDVGGGTYASAGNPAKSPSPTPKLALRQSLSSAFDDASRSGPLIPEALARAAVQHDNGHKPSNRSTTPSAELPLPKRPSLGSRQSSLGVPRQPSLGAGPSRQASLEGRGALLTRSGTLVRPSLTVFNEISLDVGLIACSDAVGDTAFGAEERTPRDRVADHASGASDRTMAQTQEVAGPDVCLTAGARDKAHAKSDVTQQLKSRPAPAAGSPEVPREQLPQLQQALQRTTVVTEVLDSRTLSLVKDMNLSKYITSSDLAAQLLALISCAPEREEIYRELLWPGGNTFSIRPVMTIVDTVEVLSFYEASERVLALFGEVLLGYMDRNGKTIINPATKSRPTVSRNAVDVLVTIAWGGTSD